YQDRDGERRPVSVAYRVSGREYGFVVGVYDPALPLIIDPLLQSTYLGGGKDEYALALAIAPGTGEVYVTGYTNSTDFPGTAGGAQSTFGGLTDVFVARLSSDLTSLLHATYLGGSSAEQGVAIAIAGTGDVYVAGYTLSPNFPGTAGGAQPAFGGGSDAFVARLSSDLTALLKATYLGGSGVEQAFALAIHPSNGDVYVAGVSQSTDFPGTGGGAQPAKGGGADAFVARLSSTLTTFTQATYLGGTNGEGAFALAIDPTSGDTYVAGSTASSDMPGTTGGAQSAYGGGTGDTFIARLPSTLTSLTQATYLGGTGTDSTLALAIHPTGDVYATGLTQSANFPGTIGGVQATYGGGGVDGFVARLSGSLTALLQATYLGGSINDNVNALAIHPTSGDLYVAGNTSSDDFPGTAGGAQSAKGGGLNSGFVARLTRGLDPGPVLSITPSSVNFGTVNVNGSADRTFTVQNAGGGTLTGTAATSGAPFSVVGGSP
ncbi:MAG: SBBP repeat-containing protein, partial [Actinomycetota bacterium]